VAGRPIRLFAYEVTVLYCTTAPIILHLLPTQPEARKGMEGLEGVEGGLKDATTSLRERARSLKLLPRHGFIIFPSRRTIDPSRNHPIRVSF
jgi:hypothetical protein